MRRGRRAARSRHVTKWFKILRQAISMFLNDLDFREQILGGPGLEVEFDEMCATQKRKYGVGSAPSTRPNRWVFGATERNTEALQRLGRLPRRRFFVCANRSRATLAPLIERYVHRASRTYSDFYSSYAHLAAAGWHHRMVNHSTEFVNRRDPEVHTETIEGVWKHVRRHLNANGGTRTEHLQHRLDEFSFFCSYAPETDMPMRMWLVLRILARFGMAAKALNE